MRLNEGARRLGIFAGLLAAIAWMAIGIYRVVETPGGYRILWVRTFLAVLGGGTLVFFLVTGFTWACGWVADGFRAGRKT